MIWNFLCEKLSGRFRNRQDICCQDVWEGNFEIWLFELIYLELKSLMGFDMIQIYIVNLILIADLFHNSNKKIGIGNEFRKKHDINRHIVTIKKICNSSIWLVDGYEDYFPNHLKLIKVIISSIPENKEGVNKIEKAFRNWLLSFCLLNSEHFADINKNDIPYSHFCEYPSLTT